ncbi:protein FAM177A1 [Trichonephila clavipes]|nr:protein FAM177A1 [Trichonephila clavipes]
MVNSCDEKTSFTEINLAELQRKKAPKRLVYFSDGILEEYSTDEDEFDNANQDAQPLIDPKTLPWIPYFGYWFWYMGSQALAGKFVEKNEKVSNHGSILITIDCNVVAFEEGFHQPIKRTKQSVFLDVTVFRQTLVD